MTFRDLIKKVAKQEGIPYGKTESIVNTLLNVISGSLAEDIPVRLKRFATLKPFRVKARNRYIPGSGATMKYPPKNSVKLVLANDLKEQLNNRTSG